MVLSYFDAVVLWCCAPMGLQNQGCFAVDKEEQTGIKGQLDGLLDKYRSSQKTEQIAH